MLDTLLDEFQQQYQHITIEKKPIDITDCFITAPKNYGDLKRNTVLAYVVHGAPLAEKYFPDQYGKLKIKKFDHTILMLTCLCLYDMRNTSLHEISDALKYSPSIQGFDQETIARIVKRFPEFELSTDTAFMFAGKAEEVGDRIALNALWLSQIINYGKRMPEQMNDEEAKLMEKVFPKQVLDNDAEWIQKRSYMFGKKTHTPVSEEFLGRKIASYQKYLVKDAHFPALEDTLELPQQESQKPAGDTVISRMKGWYSTLRENKDGKAYTGLVDTIGNVTYSLAVGIPLDYSTLHSWAALVTSRASATTLNATTGGLYGVWKDKVYRKMHCDTTSSRWKRGLAELVAFNTVQVPIYGIGVAIGAIVKYFTHDDMQAQEIYRSAIEGMQKLVVISPLIGPTMGIWMGTTRKLFGVKTATERTTEYLHGDQSSL